MKKLKYYLIALVLVSICCGAHAQVVTTYGDNLSTLNGIIKAYYDVVTVEKGQKPSYQRDSMLHVPNVNVGWATRSKDGKTGVKYVTLKEYHRQSDDYLAASGFYEKEISRKVEKFGAIYHVWSTYESRNTKTGPVIERGINSIELFYDGARFWILGWFFDNERKDNPIPAKYLTK